MARYYARDITSAIITKLTTDFNTMLATIDTERTDTTPTALTFTSGWQNGQYPMIAVDVTESNFEIQELAADVDHVTEIFSVEVKAILKSADTRINQWLENYLEALYRVLQNYTSANITWIMAVASIRDEIQSVDNSFMKTGGIKFEVRIN